MQPDDKEKLFKKFDAIIEPVDIRNLNYIAFLKLLPYAHPKSASDYFKIAKNICKIGVGTTILGVLIPGLTFSAFANSRAERAGFSNISYDICQKAAFGGSFVGYWLVLHHVFPDVYNNILTLSLGPNETAAFWAMINFPLFAEGLVLDARRKFHLSPMCQTKIAEPVRRLKQKIIGPKRDF